MLVLHPFFEFVPRSASEALKQKLLGLWVEGGNLMDGSYGI